MSKLVPQQFDPKHDTRPRGFYEDIKVIRVPVKRIVLPSPSGTSRDKYEPAFLLPLILEHWKSHWIRNPQLKPRMGAVPAHLPQWRNITDVDGERSRLAQVYGSERNSGVANVDRLFPGDRLWEEIKKVGEYITLRRDAHHECYVDGTAEIIAPDASPYDVVDLGNIVNVNADESEDEEIETDASLEEKRKAEAARQARAEKRQKREAILAQRMAKHERSEESLERRITSGSDKPQREAEQQEGPMSTEDIDPAE